MLMRARYASSCARCGRPVGVGEKIDYDPARGSVCEGCIREVQDAERALYDQGMGLLQTCGVRSGTRWDQSILDGAVSFGVAAQFRDDVGRLCTVERWKLRGLPMAVQTVYLDTAGQRVEYLWAPEEVQSRVSLAPRSPAAAPVKPKAQQPATASKPAPKPSGAAAPARPAPAAQPAPAAPALGPIVVDPLPNPEDDEKFRTPPSSAPSLGLIVNVHRISGLFWASLPEGADDARTALKSAGFKFHVGTGSTDGKSCPQTCEACTGRLRDGVWFTREAKVARRFSRYLSPDAQAAAEGARSAFEESRAASADIHVPAPEGLRYYPYQLAGIRWCIDRPSVLLSDDCGLGKTIQVIGTINSLPAIKRVLVVCPASLTLNWRDEARRWLTRPTKVAVLESAHDLPKAKATERLFAITNYEMLIKHRGHNLFGHLLAGTWDLIAVDEAHRLCNQKESATAQAVVGVLPKRLDTGSMTLEVPGLLSRAMRRILATGTPFRNRPRELWPLIHALDPVHFDDEKRFLMRYCDNGEVRRGRRKYDGAAHLEELQDRLRAKSNGGKGMMIRRLKADVLPELPPKVRQIIALPVPQSAAKLVNLELKDYAKDRGAIEAALAHADMLALRGLHQEYSGAVAKLHSAGKIAFNRMAAIRHEVGRAKAPVVIDHLKSMLDGGFESVIVFGHHHDVIEMIVAGLAQCNPVQITGNENKTQKYAAVEKFMKDKSCRVLVGNISAAGEGITLHRSSTVVFAELSFVPGQMTQAEDRAHRIGQASSVLVQHLVFDGSVDQRMATILVEKTGMAEAALDVAQTDAFPSASLKQAAEQRMRNHYPDEVRDAARKAAALVPVWKQSWLAVGNWITAQPSLNNRQCDIALRCLRYHAEYIPMRLSAKLGIGTEKKKSTNLGERS